MSQGFSGGKIPAPRDETGTAACLGNDVQYVAAGCIHVKGYTLTEVSPAQVCPAQVRPTQVRPLPGRLATKPCSVLRKDYVEV